MERIAFVAGMLGFGLLVWFRTDAFAEYMNLMKFERFFKIAEYNELHRNGYEGNFPDFLYEYYKDFFIVRLITCPICLTFWLSLLSSTFCSFTEAVIAAPLALFSYAVLNKML